jgi:hypothetical protein
MIVSEWMLEVSLTLLILLVPSFFCGDSSGIVDKKCYGLEMSFEKLF